MRIHTAMTSPPDAFSAPSSGHNSIDRSAEDNYYSTDVNVPLMLLNQLRDKRSQETSPNGESQCDKSESRLNTIIEESEPSREEGFSVDKGKSSDVTHISEDQRLLKQASI